MGNSRKIWTAPPGWPTPPEGWQPEPGWQPDPTWPPPPQGWQFWREAAAPGRAVLVGRWMKGHKWGTAGLVLVALVAGSAIGSPSDSNDNVAVLSIADTGSKTNVTPTPAPTQEVTPEPTPEATPEPTPDPTPAATPKATPKPTPKPNPKSSNCDPNYSGACVPIASDVDCAGGGGNGPAYVQGPVRVTGKDIYGLDRDGDGVGCDG